MDSGRLVFSSAAPPCRAAGSGGGQMLLFGGHVGFLGGSPVMADVGEDGRLRKRPFLRTHEELELQMDLVDELYGGLDEQGSSARKRRLTAEQVQALERSFEEEKRKLEPERKNELARRLGIAPRQVAVWFQNRRARWKTKQLELDFDRLRAAHDELLAGRDALAADNESLRSQVILLTEKLQANGKSSSLAPAEQTAVPAVVHATTVLAAESGKSFQLEEGRLYDAAGSTTNGGGVAMSAAPAPRLAAARAANDSPESYFAGARSPPSSSEDDCGGSDDDPSSSVLCPDAVLVGASFEHAMVATMAADEEAPLNSWEWLWN